jgi:hypothetical protein
VGGDVPVDSETLLMTDFVNLKIKSAQSFGGAHRGSVCMCVFIDVSAPTYMSICVCTVFLKKDTTWTQETNETSGVNHRQMSNVRGIYYH